MSVSTTPERVAQSAHCERPDLILSGPDPGVVEPTGLATSVSTSVIIPAKRRRIKAPKDSKIYKSVLVYLAYKAQGLKGPEIAEKIGITAHTLRQYVCYANKKGWLNINSLDMPEDKIDVILASKAVRNVNLILDERMTGDDGESRIPTTRSGEVALEVMKGVGLLKTHQVVKNDGQAPSVFALKVEVINPPAPTAQQPAVSLREGSFGGAPYYDAEVIE